MNRVDYQIERILADKKYTGRQDFYQDTLEGLKSKPKYLYSKYFYDICGDKLFQKIMHCEDYYLYRSELEIFTEQVADFGKAMLKPGDEFDLIELGAGDATKSILLLRYLLGKGAAFNYLPIDISGNILAEVEESLREALPGLRMCGLNGEYFDMLKKATTISGNRKVVLFLGSTLGNMPVNKAHLFCAELRRHLVSGDQVMVGIDLVKNPKTILAAYNDKEGITRDFNLNLLTRINRELDADFDLSQFDHYPVYDPETSSCKSYLISLADQEVKIGDETIRFAKNESIYTEVSQKYTLQEMDEMAREASFRPTHHFFDRENGFMSVIWQAM